MKLESKVYNIIIKNSTIIDGTGKEGFKADLAIDGEKIAAIGQLSSSEAKLTIEAEGLIVSPGFIDIHTHTDFQLLVNPKGESKIFQGITTDVSGNCGTSVAPLGNEQFQRLRANLRPYEIEVDWRDLGGFYERLEREKIGLNYASFVGNGTIRAAVMGYESHPANKDEMEAMKNEVAKAMEQGALGLSTGLVYTPSLFADTDEIIELTKTIKPYGYGGIYASHIRGEGDTLLAAIQEAITVGQKAEVPVQVSHLKASGKKNWGKAEAALKMIDEARGRGIDVTSDRYPYLAGSTGLTIFIPVWARDGGVEKLISRLKDSETRQRIKYEMKAQALSDERFWDDVLICIDGKTVTDWAKQRNIEPEEVVCQLLIENDARVSICHFTMCQEDTDLILKHPQVMIGSDASARAPYGPLSQDVPHPRSYGTFPRVISDYVRERNLFSLSEAIKKMTSSPASRLNLKDRGVIRTNAYADICIFDYDTISDNATYVRPHQYPSGIEYVIVNGQVVIEKGKHTGRLPGKVLR